jgi:hypothetical protein
LISKDKDLAFGADKQTFIDRPYQISSKVVIFVCRHNQNRKVSHVDKLYRAVDAKALGIGNVFDAFPANV